VQAERSSLAQEFPVTRVAAPDDCCWAEGLGRFDRSADVDVFVAHLAVGSKSAPRVNTWQWSKETRRSTVADHFFVQVGTIVPHRDRKTGRQRAFLNAKAAPRWGICKRLNEHVRTKRSVFKPPFVVIRRTSSPRDKMRAVATIVVGRRQVAVENHLLVLTPHKKSVKQCWRLIENLKSKKTTDWLNQRIRCPHLTVAAVSAIPWWSN